MSTSGRTPPSALCCMELTLDRFGPIQHVVAYKEATSLGTRLAYAQRTVQGLIGVVVQLLLLLLLLSLLVIDVADAVNAVLVGVIVVVIQIELHRFTAQTSAALDHRCHGVRRILHFHAHHVVVYELFAYARQWNVVV